MGNRILNISSNSVQVSENEEIYTDISMLGKDSEVTNYKTSSLKPNKDDYFQYLEVEKTEDPVRKEETIEKIMIASKSGYAEALRLYNELTETGDKFKVNRSINVRAV